MTSLLLKERTVSGMTESLLPETTSSGNIEEHLARATRQSEIDDLCAYQRKAISELESEVEMVDRQITVAEALLAEGANRTHALRGLVHMRTNALAAQYDTNGTQSADASTGREAKTRRHDYRGRGRQPRVRAREALPSKSLGDGSTCGEDHSTIPIIGTVYSEFSKRYEAPRQSFQGPAGSAFVVLNKTGSAGVQEALKQLKPGGRIWLVYWFDRNAGFWREMVRPPRARGGWRVGLFATRSPHRPTPVGVSLAEVRSVDIDTGRIGVRGVDILDETPILGFSLYSAEADCHKSLRSGWLDDTDKLQPLYYDDLDAGVAESLEVEVVYDESVEKKLSFVDTRTTIDVFGMLRRTLSRMVKSDIGDLHTLDGRSERRQFPLVSNGNGEPPNMTTSELELMYPVGAWRIWYSWDGGCDALRIVEVTSGIRKEVVVDEGDVDREIREHRTFNKQFNQVHIW